MRIRSTILGFATLIVLLTAGAAQSLSGSNTVFSDDIVDGTITTPDLKTGALSGSKILDNSVTGTDINEATIPGFKKVYFARVMFVWPDGTESSTPEARLFGGDAAAVTVALSAPYEFNVRFPFTVTACAPSVTSGTVPGLAPPALARSNPNAPSAYTTIRSDPADTVSVNFKQVIGGAAAATVDSFSLTLVCP